MTARSLSVLLPLLALAAPGCFSADRFDDDNARQRNNKKGGGGNGVEAGRLEAEFTDGDGVVCDALWDADAVDESGDWCPDCDFTLDADFDLDTETGDCDFESFEATIGYWPQAFEDTDVLAYEYGGYAYYWGEAWFDGDTLQWSLDLPFYDLYGGYNYNYSYAGAVAVP